MSSVPHGRLSRSARRDFQPLAAPSHTLDVRSFPDPRQQGASIDMPGVVTAYRASLTRHSFVHEHTPSLRALNQRV